MDRVILHCDLNNFYASCECLDNPDIRDLPVAVCGSSEDRHGIVLAKNGIAKSFGIKTGMVIWQAKNICSNLTIVNADFAKYLAYSKRVKDIYRQYTDMVESFGIDEAWLDITNSKIFGDGETIANEIRERVKNEIGLTISVGLSFNKIFAKLGSDIKKPDALTIITRENYKQIVHPLLASELLYVGKATSKKLENIGIYTIGDIANSKVEYLKRQLGKWGEYLHIFANGRDDSVVSNENDFRGVKSIGNSMTNYKDIKSIEEAKILIFILCESVIERARNMGIKRIGVVHITVKDANLETYQKQQKLLNPTILVSEVGQIAIELFSNLYSFEVPCRAIGIAVSDFHFNNIQLSLTDYVEKTDKIEKLENTISNIRKKHGFQKIKRGVVLEDNKLSSIDIGNEHIIHPKMDK